jgi:hypothetical protein
MDRHRIGAARIGATHRAERSPEHRAESSGDASSFCLSLIAGP